MLQVTPSNEHQLGRVAKLDHALLIELQTVLPTDRPSDGGNHEAEGDFSWIGSVHFIADYGNSYIGPYSGASYLLES